MAYQRWYFYEVSYETDFLTFLYISSQENKGKQWIFLEYFLYKLPVFHVRGKHLPLFPINCAKMN